MFILFRCQCLGMYLDSKIDQTNCLVIPSIDLNISVLYSTMVNMQLK